MGELSMGTVNWPPFLDQLQDRSNLPVEQPVHRAAARGSVDERADMEQARPPAMHPHVRDEEHATGALVRPTLGHGVIYELQQALFDLTGNPGRDGTRAQAQDLDFPLICR